MLPNGICNFSDPVKGSRMAGVEGPGGATARGRGEDRRVREDRSRSRDRRRSRSGDRRGRQRSPSTSWPAEETGQAGPRTDPAGQALKRKRESRLQEKRKNRGWTDSRKQPPRRTCSDSGYHKQQEM